MGNERARKNMLSFDFGSLTVPHLAVGFFIQIFATPVQ